MRLVSVDLVTEITSKHPYKDEWTHPSWLFLFLTKTQFKYFWDLDCLWNLWSNRWTNSLSLWDYFVLSHVPDVPPQGQGSSPG